MSNGRLYFIAQALIRTGEFWRIGALKRIGERLRITALNNGSKGDKQ